MSDPPALPPVDDEDDDVVLLTGWLVDGEDRYRLIREKGEENRWIASTYWLERNDGSA